MMTLKPALWYCLAAFQTGRPAQRLPQVCCSSHRRMTFTPKSVRIGMARLGSEPEPTFMPYSKLPTEPGFGAGVPVLPPVLDVLLVLALSLDEVLVP